jgi:hypothetical protein
MADTARLTLPDEGPELLDAEKAALKQRVDNRVKLAELGLTATPPDLLHHSALMSSCLNRCGATGLEVVWARWPSDAAGERRGEFSSDHAPYAATRALSVPGRHVYPCARYLITVLIARKKNPLIIAR